MFSASGSYDRRLTINNYAESVDGSGTRSLTWSAVASDVPCRVIPSGGNEVFNENERVALNNKTFAIRWASSYTPSEGMQIVYEGATFNIQNVYENTKVGKRVEWMITAVAKDNS